MKKIITVVILFISVQLRAQTKLVSYRSHSGMMSCFHSEVDLDNLGEPPMYLDTIYWLSDTSCIEVSSYRWSGWPRYTDTVYHHPYCNNPDVSYDSLQELYNNDVILVGFDSTKKAEPVADSLSKQREKFKSNNKNSEKNEMPLYIKEDKIDPSGTWTYSLFLTFVAGIMLFTGIRIWQINRIRISANQKE